MSAFIVEDAVINSVVNYLATSRRHGSFEYHDLMGTEFMIDMTDPKEIEGLAVAMFRDLNFRYVGQQKIGGLVFVGEPTLPIQAYKSLGCWLYQCAEGDVPKTSLLYAAMLKVHAEMAHNIVTALPQYDMARW